jgi:hypothetical protein
MVPHSIGGGRVSFVEGGRVDPIVRVGIVVVLRGGGQRWVQAATATTDSTTPAHAARTRRLR